MRRSDLTRYLDDGNELGFLKETDSLDFVGWLLVRKIRSHIGDPSDIGREGLYQVLVIELKRSVHESDAYETNDDYRLNERHVFDDLDEVEAFVSGYGFSLDNIKWRIDLDAP